jgi:hypothetical protein
MDSKEINSNLVVLTVKVTDWLRRTENKAQQRALIGAVMNIADKVFVNNRRTFPAFS